MLLNQSRCVVVNCKLQSPDKVFSETPYLVPRTERKAGRPTFIFTEKDMVTSGQFRSHLIISRTYPILCDIAISSNHPISGGGYSYDSGCTGVAGSILELARGQHEPPRGRRLRRDHNTLLGLAHHRQFVSLCRRWHLPGWILRNMDDPVAD